MQHARPFQPDLVVWLFSMLAFQDIRQDVPFVIENPSAVRELIDQYGLTHDLTGTVPNRFWDGTLIGERTFASWLANAAPPVTITERQAAVAELAPDDVLAALAAVARRERENSDDVDDGRSRLPHADLRSRTVLPGAETSED